MTEQLDAPAPAGASVHADPPPNEPDALLENVIVPAGVLGWPVSESETVAVQVVVAPVKSAAGEQVTDVALVRSAIVHWNDVLAEAPAASLTVTVAVEDPAVVGTPEITPVAGSIDSPAGRPVAA
jgi:hypothetical protein